MLYRQIWELIKIGIEKGHLGVIMYTTPKVQVAWISKCFVLVLDAGDTEMGLWMVEINLMNADYFTHKLQELSKRI